MKTAISSITLCAVLFAALLLAGKIGEYASKPIVDALSGTVHKEQQVTQR